MQSQVGEIYEGKVTGLTTFGAFVKLSNGETGMVHISEVATVFVKDIKEHLAEGQDVKVKVLAVNENNKISLSIKQALPKPENPQPQRRFTGKPQGGQGYNNRQNSQKQATAQRGPMSFEEMMAKFKQESDEKMSDLKRTSEQSARPRRSGKQ